MKSLLVSASITGAAIVSGCAFHQPSVVVDSVGPPSVQPATAGPKGALTVYSAPDTDSEFSDIFARYTDYRILSEDGKLLQTVHNNNGSVLDSPQRVELPAGRYRIVARATGYKLVTVPVVILADRLTAVHLEGGASWPENAALLKSNPVRLPNGEIVGWRANTEIAAQP